MPGKVSEARWERAKNVVRSQYPNLDRQSSRFWALVQTVYQRMVDKAVEDDLELVKAGEPGTITSGKQNKLADRYSFQGLRISIENAQGSYRTGEGWRSYMHYDYGYIRGTEGEDDEHLDCYVGPDRDCTHAYVVHQLVPESGDYDEDKVMLGFPDEESAKSAYLKQYDNPRFFGGIRPIPMDAFKVMLRYHQGKRLTTGDKDKYLNKAVMLFEKFAKAGLQGLPDVRQETGDQPPPDARMWEPPGGTHPKTWRAQVGDRYMYRQASPGEVKTYGDSQEFKTTRELASIRTQFAKMKGTEHRQAARSAKNELERAFHLFQAQKKEDFRQLTTPRERRGEADKKRTRTSQQRPRSRQVPTSSARHPAIDEQERF